MQFTLRPLSGFLEFVSAAGLGLAVLPCYLADPDPGLVRTFEPIPDLARELWIVTHADLKGTARVRAFLSLAGDAIAARRPLIEGREPQPPKSRW